MMEKRESKSKWGPDDEIGALKEISTEVILSAKGLVKSGRIIELSHVLENGIPSDWFHGEFQYSTFRRHEDSAKVFPSTNKFRAMNMRLEMADHMGTHLDSLNHVSEDGQMYNHQIASELTDNFGTSKLGVEKLPPIFTRGIFIDVTNTSKVSRELQRDDNPITSDDIKRELEAKGLDIKRGDAVLVATGWERYWMVDNKKYLGPPCPGIGMDAARFLAEKGVSLVGTDTAGIEIDPSEKSGEMGTVHQFLLVKKGIILVENLKLEQLRKEHITEFLFVCLPLKIKGGTGSPVSPIAVI
ncbi:MAG: cyclase family protein [Thaumarchaeota archaeon]|nr:cyclase family protein [Nitrososphaerota archaeon]